MQTVPIIALSPVHRQIDAATIHRLYHEEGMSVKDVAETCGICADTVRRYLEPLKKGKRPASEKLPKPAPKIAALPKHAPVRPNKLVQSKVELRGATAVFEIDLEASTLFARGSTFEFIMTREEVESLIWELVEAHE